MRTGLNIDYINTRLNISPNKYKIAIVLHVYYEDSWLYFKNKLKNLNINFDLHITLCQEHPNKSYLLYEIQKSFPTAQIYEYENRGQDIGPFLKTFSALRNKNYDFLIKLHTKKSAHYDAQRGKAWRESLVMSLIKSDSTIKKNIYFLESSSFKMCGSKEYLMDSEMDTSAQQDDFCPEAKEYFDKDYLFIGGTMFMVDFKTYTKILTDDMINYWYGQMPYGYIQDRSFTHGAERLLGAIVIQSGYKIKGI